MNYNMVNKKTRNKVVRMENTCKREGEAVNLSLVIIFVIFLIIFYLSLSFNAQHESDSFQI